MANIYYKNGSTFTSVLNIVYPVGSLYFSTSATSPASSVGGTWTQLNENALIGATKTSSKAETYQGDIRIRHKNMPIHGHGPVYYGDSGNATHTWSMNTIISTNLNSYRWDSKTSMRAQSYFEGLPVDSASGRVYANWTDSQIDTYYSNNNEPAYLSGTVSGGDQPAGGGQPYYPYQFDCYVWYRTA